MEEQKVNFETAKLAKEKGFDKLTDTMYVVNEYLVKEQDSGKPYRTGETTIYRPTQALLQKWLRDKHNIIVEIGLDQTSYPKYCFSVYKYEDFGNWEEIKNPDWGLYSSEEKALEDALVLGLQNVSETVA